MSRPLLVLALLPVVAGAAPVPKALRKVPDEVAVLGVWELKTADDGDGAGPLPDPKGRVIRYTFKSDGKVTISEVGVDSNEFDYKVDPTAAPKSLDFRGKVVTSLELYELDGDTLRTCTPKSPGATRPIEFKALVPTTSVFNFKRLDRDSDKVRRRVEEVARTAARRIDAVVVDGNNLCDEGARPVGLAAVEALLPLLSRTWAVVVVFDASVRRLLMTDDSALQRRLAGHTRVHVVASRRAADETVLDLAAASEFTYVRSNDRFGDFNDKPAVRGGRIIRHEIVNGNVFVHDLQLRAAYRPTAE